MTVTLPFITAKDRKEAAEFIGNLICSGSTALFNSKIINNEMVITFSGGY